MTKIINPVDTLNLAACRTAGGNKLSDISFEEGDPLTTAILLSLFTDRRAYDSDDVDRYSGWWGSELGEQGQMGSRLWTLIRKTHYTGIENDVFNMASEALQWMIEDKVASDITIEVSSPNNYAVSMRIRVIRNQKLIKELKFENLWELLDTYKEYADLNQ